MYSLNKDFFLVKTYPEITFKSSTATKKADGGYTITGDFKMKDVSKSVNIDAKVSTEGGKKYLEGTLPINRLDYHVGSATDGVATKLTAHLKYPIK